MKHRIAIVLLLVFAVLSLRAQQPKRVFITLDVSKSMEGNKYVMANYTAQLISVFCDDTDIVTLYYLNEKHDLSKNDDYKQLHINFDKLPDKKQTYHEVADLKQLMADYQPDPNYQDWLFIIGDGDWDWKSAKSDYDQTVKNFDAFLKANPINVCYLQTGNTLDRDFAFTQFLHRLGDPRTEMRRSDTTAASVLGHCAYFANRILGFSNSPIHIDKNDDCQVSFRSEFPLQRFLLLCQSNNLTTNDIQLESVTCGGKALFSQIKGNPTTKPLVKQGQPYMNGAVLEVKSDQPIPADQEVRVRFNSKVEKDGLVVYPFVDVRRSLRPWSVANEALPESQSNVFDLCRKENKVKVVLQLTDRDGNQFPPALMQRTTVRCFAGTEEFLPDFNVADTSYSLILDMPDTTLSYYLTLESPGYFDWITETQTVRKTDRCPIEPVAPIPLPAQRFAPVTFDDLIKGKGFGGTVSDTLFRLLADLGDFDIQRLESGGDLFDQPTQFSLSDCDLQFTHQPKSSWCECNYPDTLRFQVTLLSSEGIVVGDKSYEGFHIPVVVPVDHRPWWIRCRNYLFLAVGLLLFILYLWAMLRKRRFGKSARVVPSYYNYDDELVEQSGSRLRKRGVLPWLKRWLSPRDERVVLYWSRPDTGAMRFIAGESNKVVHIARSSINPETMHIAGYQNRKGKDNTPTIRWSANGKIDFVKPNGEPDGRLAFSPGDKNDLGGYRAVVILLMLAALAAEAYLVYTLFSSFF